MTAAEQAADLGTPGDGAAAPATKNEREEDSMARGPKGPPLHKLPAHVLEKGPGVINPPHLRPTALRPIHGNP
ncbi:hypothetical protein GCM10010964_44000 [Caldovatus sediminis]|uniref:Uncharacterized protein n=1 Tax=Caldovatus sediminis TaxID=2041189 RepID=A0A8J3EED8_9PROT|nr:hypothetical protein GCM10010964_44000 [Caldovatus sediminis]